MGLRFTVKTFCAVALVSVFSGLHPKFVQFSSLTPFYIAVIGDFLMGTGFIVLASMLGAVALNLVIMLNHRPGRYMAV